MFLLMKKTDRNFLILFGVLTVLLGLFVLGAQVFATALSMVILGWILMAAGASLFFYSFFSGSASKVVAYLISGFVSFIIGLIVITNPLLSAATLTLLISIMLLVNGILSMGASLVRKDNDWGWAFFGGLVSFFLGSSILMSWPVSGLWVIGLFIGIHLVLSGFTMLASTSERSIGIERREYTSQYVAGAKGGKATKSSDNK